MGRSACDFGCLPQFPQLLSHFCVCSVTSCLISCEFEFVQCICGHRSAKSMGRKCFAPRCKTGYKSCSQKLSLFCAPKDEERLKVWRNAIPRKDRVLQPSDYLCERHFETHFVSKTWEAVYNGNVLISTPRKASLSKDAVPTKFPDCPTYLSKETKRRKRPAERHNRGAPAKKPCTENKVRTDRVRCTATNLQ